MFVCTPRTHALNLVLDLRSAPTRTLGECTLHETVNHHKDVRKQLSYSLSEFRSK